MNTEADTIYIRAIEVCSVHIIDMIEDAFVNEHGELLLTVQGADSSNWFKCETYSQLSNYWYRRLEKG